MAVARRLCLVVGARPNFVKAAPLVKALDRRTGVATRLVHTGQHADDQLSGVFFRELGIRPPDVFLGGEGRAVSGSHARQTAAIMTAFEDYLLASEADDEPIDRVVVIGDVNSTLACALAAGKVGVPVAHVEAGLRSFDRSMPEEVNRVAVDAIADLWFCSEPAAVANLRNEGKPAGRVHLVGNVMIDTLKRSERAARRRNAPGRFGVLPHHYVLVTLHRPGNVDDPAVLVRWCDALLELGESLPVLFLVHPRTAKRLESLGLTERLKRGGLSLVPPLGYLDCLGLTADAAVVVTDSGGLQEETTALGVPCLTLRPNTERPITVLEGTSTLVGEDDGLLTRLVDKVFARRYSLGRCPPLWDGRAAHRIADILAGPARRPAAARVA